MPNIKRRVHVPFLFRFYSLKLLLPFRNAFLFLMACLAVPLYLVYLKTIRIKSEGDEFMPHRRPSSEQAIYVTWHAKTFLIIPFCSYLKIGIITLLDWKNIFYGYMCRLMGYQTIPVRKSSQATRQLMRFLKQGTNVALALDGPWGPAGKMKSGAFFLAQKTNSPIIPVRIETEKSWRMNWRWDRYEIPKPFSRIRVFISPAISAGENIETARAKVLKWIGPA